MYIIFFKSPKTTVSFAVLDRKIVTAQKLLLPSHDSRFSKIGINPGTYSIFRLENLAHSIVIDIFAPINTKYGQISPVAATALHRLEHLV